MTTFETESWLWYGIVMAVTSLRFLSRYLHLKSVLRFQIEDYLMIVIACAYTVFIVLINIAMVTNSNLIDPEDTPSFTPEDIAERTYGSKLILAVEQLMCLVQWGTKACLLLLYYRLTENLVHNKFVKAVGLYVGATYVVMIVLYFGYWCQPFSDYWKTPATNVQCTTAINHLIVNLTFNLTCDVLIMSIPLPLLIRTRLEIKRKILLCFPFTLGFFTIICAAISKYVSFTHPYSPVWSFWYTREASCVIIVANMPYIWGLVRRLFKLKSFWGRGDTDSECNDTDTASHDTGMEIVRGEIREIRGRGFSNERPTRPNMSENGLGLGWKEGSNEFEKDNKVHLSAHQVNIEVTDVSGKTSPTCSHSGKSTAEDQWNNIDWNRPNSEGQITQVCTRQSDVSPDSLAPPTPAMLNTGTRRGSAVDHGRENRRMSTYSSKRGRLSCSEASRRSTKHSLNVDAMDRLYRLDDEDLVADIEAARPRSQNSHRNDFD